MEQVATQRIITHRIVQYLSVLVIFCAIQLPRTLAAEEEAQQAIGDFTLTGGAQADPDVKHKDSPAIRVPAKGAAVKMLRKTDGGGKVTLWIKEDLKASEKKDRRCGPTWGLVGKDGNVLVVGAIYAPYLNGAKTYASGDFPKPQNWGMVQYLKEKRREGWSKWTFDFDTKKGLTIYRDDKPVSRFKWNQTKFTGFAGIGIYGDASPTDTATVWVADATYSLAGAVTATPSPAVAQSAVPEKDPTADKPVSYLPEVRKKHPRLLWTADDLAAMRKRATGASKEYLDQTAGYVAVCNAPKNAEWASNDTDAQRQGFWRSSTIAVHYAATGDPKDIKRATGMLKAFLDQPVWQTGKEIDSGMGAANICFGAGLLYDAFYNDLEPEFREKVRKKLIYQARQLYYYGFLSKSNAIHYWQSDPQNNHRWHRLAGLTSAVFAAAEDDDPQTAWLLQKTAEEVKFVHDWLPEDGSYHDSPSYMIFGNVYGLCALDITDRVLGTKYMEHPYWKNNTLFRLHTLQPSFQDVLRYGDGGGLSNNNYYFFRAAADDKDLQTAIRQFRKRSEGKGFMWGWQGLLWDRPEIAGEGLKNIPFNAFYDDMGILYTRSDWSEQSAAGMFKCGPLGGYKLNKFRNDNDYKYINVAHDHCDANSFELYAGGKLLATDDTYPSKHRFTASHNTITVNGKGQKGDAKGFTQPYKGKDKDMSSSAVIVVQKNAPGLAVAEGDATGTYQTKIDHFRRHYVWADQKYVLVIDNLQAEKPVSWEWNLHSPNITKTAADSFQLSADTVSRDMIIRSTAEGKPEIIEDISDSHGKNYNRGKHLKMVYSGQKEVRIATAIDLWEKKLSLEVKDLSAAEATVTVTGEGINDVWKIKFKTTDFSPSEVTLTRDGKDYLTITAADKAKRPYFD